VGERAEGEMDFDKEEFEQGGEGTVRRNEGSLESDGKSSTEGDLGELVVYTLLERRRIPFRAFPIECETKGTERVADFVGRH